MPDCVTTRINEELLGRIITCKLRGLDGLTLNSDEPIRIQSTVLPDQKFESFAAWRESIRQDYLAMERAKLEQKENKLIMDNNLQHQHNWLSVKWNKIN